MDKLSETVFLKISEIKPNELRDYTIAEIGEKSIHRIYSYLSDLTNIYPNFKEWYYDVVFPEVKQRKGNREIIVCLSNTNTEENVVLSGIAILKSSPEEKKICAIRILENYRDKGIGKELFEACFEFLGTKKPLITVASPHKRMFEKYIDLYDFRETQILENYYVEGITEYVYNGMLKT